MTGTATREQEGRELSLIKKYRKAFLGEFTEAILAAVVVAVILRLFFVSVYRVPTDSMAPALVPGDFILGWKTSYGVRLPFTDISWGNRMPMRGDVVAFRLPGDRSLYVKRVIALPGDRVSVVNGKVSVNEEPLTSEPLSADSLSHLVAPEILSLGLGLGGGVDTVELQVEAVAGEAAESADSKMTHVVMRRKDAYEADFLAAQIVPPGEVFLMGDFRSESVDSRQWGAVPISAIESRIAWVALSLRSVPVPEATEALSGANSGVTSEATTGAAQSLGKVRWNRLFQKVR